MLFAIMSIETLNYVGKKMIRGKSKGDFNVRGKNHSHPGRNQ